MVRMYGKAIYKRGYIIFGMYVTDFNTRCTQLRGNGASPLLQIPTLKFQKSRFSFALKKNTLISVTKSRKLQKFSNKVTDSPPSASPPEISEGRYFLSISC